MILSRRMISGLPFPGRKLPIALFEQKNYNTAMERRRSSRIKINLKAERLSGNEKYGVFIEDISENGIHIITTASSEHRKYAVGTDIDLRFLLSSGETLNLHCKVIWAHSKVPPDQLTDSIGLEIMDPPAKYIEFVKALR
jgi:PilZ domain